MDQSDKIFIAGINGMVGSAIKRKLINDGFKNILGPSSSELDLRKQSEVDNWFKKNEPDYVFLAAAKVGGILANNIYRADFIIENLQIETTVIKAALDYNVKKLLFLGSSCIYPKMATQPISESSLLTSSLEPTNEPYAIAKIAGVKMCEAIYEQYKRPFISAMPTNLYGINDNYDINNSHVLPALLRKIHEAKEANKAEVIVWGSGTPLREFMYADDLGEACVFLMQQYNEKEPINVGSGLEISIAELALLIKNIVGYQGKITYDDTKPDGTPRKLMNTTKLNNLGWYAKTNLKNGIEQAYKDFQSRSFDKK